MKLTWHSYRYYPYERSLALREVKALLRGQVRELPNGIEVAGQGTSAQAERLVYFSQVHDGKLTIDTLQAKLERAVSGSNRQATRYSVHGLHEYKGKFNPQVAKAILNIFGVRSGDAVFDPFCGSGTTLVECAHVGARGFGTDLNPFAVFVANAKLQALGVETENLHRILKRLETSFSRTKRWDAGIAYDDRGSYLRQWFDQGILDRIETVRKRIEEVASQHAPIFLAIASNLLRDYSLQDPNDLRIRRRSSPLPDVPFHAAFAAASRRFLDRLQEAQLILGPIDPRSQAVQVDVRTLAKARPIRGYDAAITSPPYAMALPYIDTQRLSLVWLGFITPSQVLSLESELIGSRELRGRTRRELRERLGDNADRLPSNQAAYCIKLADSLRPQDGFRRQAVPFLLYRYFADMHASFQAVRTSMKEGAPYALIVGHNHSILGGVRFDIDTPHHLSELALHAGWKVEETIELQTYHRYGYHMDNAVSAESLLLLRNS
jgi:site-specific DNA-methyltransferase (cytosine-N4-specific)